MIKKKKHFTFKFCEKGILLYNIFKFGYMYIHYTYVYISILKNIKTITWQYFLRHNETEPIEKNQKNIEIYVLKC